jgi:AcrR family transcriptional regulator
MRSDAKRQKYLMIENAAYRLMLERGYEGTSMLNIAKAANASNQTLYRWFGDKQGLFEKMVEENAEAISQELTVAIDNDLDPFICLRKVAPMLLAMLLDEKAILLNRAAACDTSGRLGKVLAEKGRNTVAPLLQQIIGRCFSASGNRQEITEIFLSLLIGDLQIRRATGALEHVSLEEIQARSDRAIEIVSNL